MTVKHDQEQGHRHVSSKQSFDILCRREREREEGTDMYSTLSLLKEARRRTEAENASDLLKAAHGDIQARPGAGVPPC